MSPNGPRRSRRELLINGRRVRISDLIDAGLLKPGHELFYQQRIGETPHQAVVTDRGRLRLLDGREFDTPSGAATAVAEVSAVPGWEVWRIGPDGPYIHQLRLQLLKDVAEEVSADPKAPTDETDAVRERFAALEDARRRADSGDPRTLTVREFIKLWRLEDRDRLASTQIDADLANHRLTTVPDFRAVSLDRTLRLVVLPDRDAEPSVVDSPQVEPAVTAPVVNEESLDIGLTLGNLVSDDAPLIWVSPSATFEEAITAMQLNDYSQIAVLAGPHTLHGAVTWESIAAAKHRNPQATFSDAIDRRHKDKVFDYDIRLLDVVDTLQQDGFLFVRDYERKITGIVTAADVVHKYNETATPFILIGEIDQELRLLLQNTFDEDTVRQACISARLTFKSFESMSIGQYQAVLDNPGCWAELGWPLDRKLFIVRLNELRKVRNNVMHFNPDPVKPSEVRNLLNFLNLIRRYSG